MRGASEAHDVAILLTRLADLHLTAAQVSGNAAADCMAAELATLAALLASDPKADDLARLRVSVDVMLDALQAQDRVSQTLDLVRRITLAAGLVRSSPPGESRETLLRDIARRSQSVQPDLAGEVATIIAPHVGGDVS